jgi:hypothetical protein
LLGGGEALGLTAGGFGFGAILASFGFGLTGACFGAVAGEADAAATGSGVFSAVFSEKLTGRLTVVSLATPLRVAGVNFHLWTAITCISFYSILQTA